MKTVKFGIDDFGIGTLSVNRPQVRNALDWDTMQLFADQIQAASSNSDLKVLLITAEGKSFISGADLGQMIKYSSRADGLRLSTIMGDALDQLESLSIITIAVINGPARGGGAEVALACDMRLMSKDANIAFLHAQLGLIPGWGGGERLLRLLGYSKALEIIATGTVLGAEEAMKIGLVNQLFTHTDLMADAKAIAKKITENDLISIIKFKELLQSYPKYDIHKKQLLERAAFVELWDREERRSAFERTFKGLSK